VYGGRQFAQSGLQNLVRSGQHRDAVPLFMGREQELKDVLQTTSARSVTEPVHQFSKGGAFGHRQAPKTFKPGKVENPGSIICFLIVVRLHVPEPISGLVAA
jgi:hypothetical protein